jgi:hypothetical protein
MIQQRNIAATALGFTLPWTPVMPPCALSASNRTMENMRLILSRFITSAAIKTHKKTQLSSSWHATTGETENAPRKLPMV